MPKPPPGIYTHSSAPPPSKHSMTKIHTHRNIKLRTPNITPRIRRLHNHLLPRNSPARKRKLIARTARRAPRVHSREAVGQVVGDGPRGLRAAHVGAPAGAAGLGVGV